MLRIYEDMGAMLRPALPAAESRRIPDINPDHPEQVVIKRVGEELRVPEYAQVWWPLRTKTPSFFLHRGPKGGGEPLLFPDLRICVFNGWTPNARLRKVGNDYTCDWSEAMDIHRQNGWDRVDLALRDFGILPRGVMSKSEKGSYEFMMSLSRRMQNGALLAQIAIHNDLSFRADLRSAQSEALKQMVILDKELERQDRNANRKSFEAELAAWRNALSEAQEILSAGIDPLEWGKVNAEPDPEPVPEPVKEIQPARNAAPRGGKR